MAGTQAVVKMSAMRPDMEQDCVDCAAHALHTLKMTEQRGIAQFIKHELDRKYGFTWHCIVGRSFGSYVAHDDANALYFFIGDCAFLVWRTESRPAVKVVNIDAMVGDKARFDSHVYSVSSFGGGSGGGLNGSSGLDGGYDDGGMDEDDGGDDGYGDGEEGDM